MRFRAIRLGSCCPLLAVVGLSVAIFQTGCSSKDPNTADRAQAQQELQQLRETNQELQKLRAENQELARLQRDNDEFHRLKKITDDLPKLRDENQRLRAQLEGLKPGKK